VLRAAGFNGLIACSLCLFGWAARMRNSKPKSPGRWGLVLIPLVFIVLASIAWRHHSAEPMPSDPPYMEFVVFVLGSAGVLLFLKPSQPAEPKKETRGRCGPWAIFAIFSALITVTAILGWWSTEVVYAEQVIYSYDSQGAAPSK
jgi:hypothetical protein